MNAAKWKKLLRVEVFFEVCIEMIHNPFALFKSGFVSSRALSRPWRFSSFALSFTESFFFLPTGQQMKHKLEANHPFPRFLRWALWRPFYDRASLLHENQFNKKTRGSERKMLIDENSSFHLPHCFSFCYVSEQQRSSPFIIHERKWNTQPEHNKWNNEINDSRNIFFSLCSRTRKTQNSDIKKFSLFVEARKFLFFLFRRQPGPVLWRRRKGHLSVQFPLSISTQWREGNFSSSFHFCFVLVYSCN